MVTQWFLFSRALSASFCFLAFVFALFLNEQMRHLHFSFT